MELDTLLEQQLEKAIVKLDSIEVGSEEYEKAAKAVATLRKSITDEQARIDEKRLNDEKLAMEDRCNGDKLEQWELDHSQIVKEKRNDKICKIISTIGSVVGTVGTLVLYGLCFSSSIEFEKTGIFTGVTTKKNLENIFRLKTK